ncbi:MAG: choloylglycine hydrolase family protein [Lachnospiraceae bacterium]|nr:choloylglycine hydrolase family protein [Lachnospiraceae bacterium]
MCTAISYRTKDHYFGRNLDFEYSFEEQVTITPRNYPFIFRRAGEFKRHYAMIGMAYVRNGYPLYYDATNEKGLSMAGLLFAGNAYYGKEEEREKDHISPFELIPWILGQCGDVKETRCKLEHLQLMEIHFDEKLPLTPLHWMIADKEECIVVEAVEEGLRIYDNPVKVLTNNPPFPYQMMNLNQYRGLSGKDVECTFAEDLDLPQYSRGMGALGLPGDLSSSSRFVRVAFHRMNSECGESEVESVSQFFHLLGSVEMPRGSVELSDGQLEKTIYSSCCNTDKGIYYYTTYENREIIGVDMRKAELDGAKVVTYPLRKRGDFTIQNS